MNIFNKLSFNYIPSIAILPLKLEYKDKKFYSNLSISDYSFSFLKKDPDKYLSKQEKEEFKILTSDLRKSSYLLGRIITKYSLMNLLKTSNIHDISITWGVLGQPIIIYKDAPNLQVSISHNNTYVSSLIFNEECPMAIDIEKIDSIRAQSIKSQLTEFEISTFVKNDIDLIILWTAKESLSKILKTGLMTDFSLYEICKLKNNNNYTEIYFKNFLQYKVLSYSFNDTICSILLPSETKLYNSKFNYIHNI
ncbi:4'-phosphopantetheinyl transferase superfamily protein [Rickettsiales bacterium]|nr:4'-phosphopantetheinyl transferase superfamily protein [Rickettsiales bacterium]